jgi:FkbM family methyltransferase
MEALLQGLDHAESLAQTSKLGRFLAAPLRYALGTGFTHLAYPLLRRAWHTEANTFFQKKMRLALPGGLDIFLTSAKTHPSEIRLARYLIRSLKAGDGFVDIGAHFGFFSLLASQLVGEHGAVLAFEPSPASFQLLAENTRACANTQAIRQAVSEKNDVLSFFEFPARYSEYNALHVGQYEQEPWFGKYRPREIRTPSVALDSFLDTMPDFYPTLVKIDVEGAEDRVLSGMRRTLNEANAPTVVMEYLADRPGSSHERAAQLLFETGYTAFFINGQGDLVPVSDIPAWLQASGLESDNIAFRKKA